MTITQDCDPMLLLTAHVLCMAYNITVNKHLGILIHSIIIGKMLTNE